MVLQVTDLVWRPARNTSDTNPAQNGGRVDLTKVIVPGVKNNLFPDVTRKQRLDGITQYRKIFLHVSPTTGLDSLLDAVVYLTAPTPGEDSVTIALGTPTGNQSDDIATANFKAILEDASWVDGTHCKGTPEVMDGTAALFPAGTVLRISTIGLEEFQTVASANTNNYDETIEITTNGTMSYFTGGMIAGCLEKALVSSSAAAVVNAATGTFSEDNLIRTQRGCADQVWTLTFTSSNAYTVTGSSFSNTFSGTVGSSLALTINGVTHLTIPAACFGGTFQANDTVEITTTSATIPIWVRRIVPAGCGSLMNDSISFTCQGEST